MNTTGQINGYSFQRLLSNSGSGEVFLAEFQGQLVAVKISSQLEDERARARFEYERLFLSRLRHSHISELVDSGYTDDGRPYISTRYIRGQSITEYVSEHQLSLNQILTILIKASDILHFAHTRGVIHRDVKPDNLLVNHSGEVYIIDFGIARETDSHGWQSGLTEHGQLLGTLGYMSPEQLKTSGESPAITADIYSLGIIAYELICSRHPLDIDNKPLHEALETLLNTDPAAASSLVEGPDAQLDAVLAKMLHKEAVNRYPSMAEVGADFRRWMENEPVLAKPPSFTEELGLLVRRNNLFFAAFASVMAVTLLAAAVSGWFAYRENIARSNAETQLERTRGLTNFLVEMIQSSNPERGGSQALTVKEVMLKAAGDVQSKISDDPKIEATIRCTIGVSFLVLGDQPTSEQQAIRGTELVASWPGTDAWEECQLALGQAQFYRLDREAARTTLYELLDTTTKPRFSNDVMTKAELNIAIADNYDGRHQEAFERMDALVKTPYETLAEFDEYRLYGVHENGVSLAGLNRFSDAANALRESVRLRTEKFSADHPQTLFSKIYLANVLSDRGDFQEARAIYDEVIEARTQAYGPAHRQTLIAKRDLLNTLVQLGELSAAEQLAAELQGNYEVFSSVAELELQARGMVGRYDAARGAVDEAVRQLEPVVDYLDSITKAPMAKLLLHRIDYAQLLIIQNRWPEARQQLEHSVAETTRYLGEEHLISLLATYAYGRQQEQRGLEIIAGFSHSRNRLKNILNPDHPLLAH